MAAAPPSTTTTADYRPVAVPVHRSRSRRRSRGTRSSRGSEESSRRPNAIIDALCGHLAESDGADGSEYESSSDYQSPSPMPNLPLPIFREFESEFESPSLLALSQRIKKNMDGALKREFDAASAEGPLRDASGDWRR
ncbi:hypothetical protein Scep_022798 [Stephania cephalantha]|uniref:Uncharacterized protein n=1 Tax=Stephania cephalantha TaxID=152367 RepID=A0AAP0FIZ4_9MAGN